VARESFTLSTREDRKTGRQNREIRESSVVFVVKEKTVAKQLAKKGTNVWYQSNDSEVRP
jgi:hypothetical protein